MAEFEDPKEIYREALARLQATTETEPPTIRRVQVWPYPELDRLWIRLETTPFAAPPSLAFTLSGPEGAVVSTMDVVEIRTPYQSLTMHLRQAPRPGALYRLLIELNRENATLDRREIEFELAYQDPDAG